jgi:hypothetical protein
MTDEILAEVHSIKDALAAQHGGDLRSLFAAIKRGEEELVANGYTVIAPPLHPVPLLGTALQRSRAGKRRD